MSKEWIKVGLIVGSVMCLLLGTGLTPVIGGSVLILIALGEL